MEAKRSGVALGVGLVALAIPVSANAAVTIGSNLEAAPNQGLNCGTTCTVSNLELPASSTAAGGLVAPSNGVVVRWRVSTSSEVSPVALRIVRLGASNPATAAGTGPTETPPANAITAFEVRLPIQAGDGVGIDCCANPGHNSFATTAGATRILWNPPLVDGGLPMTGGTFTPREILINADMEPDCDADGFGDETQDPELIGPNCPPPPEPQAQPKADRTLTLDANKTRVKKGKRVTLSGDVNASGNAAACQANQTVELQRKKPTASAFMTFQQLQTDGAGGFSLKTRVKKTREYRAVLGENQECEDATSNTEKVKVKKPK
jgi:hypothetical protein